MQVGANYNGRQPNNTAYIKTFVPGVSTSLWKTITYTSDPIVNAITPSSSKIDNLYIPGDLYVDGNIISPSDAYLKDNIEDLVKDHSINLMKLRATKFTFKSDMNKKIHYGFIAQEVDRAQIEEDKEWLNVVYKENMDRLELSQGKLIPVLVKALQECYSKIDVLRGEVEELKKKC